MTRTDLAGRIYEVHGGITRQEAKEIVGYILDEMARGLCRDGRLLVSGFGTFKVVDRKARTGRDLEKKKSVRIPEYKSVVFLPSNTWLPDNGNKR